MPVKYVKDFTTTLRDANNTKHQAGSGPTHIDYVNHQSLLECLA